MPEGALLTTTTTSGVPAIPVLVYFCPSGACTWRRIVLPGYARAALTRPRANTDGVMSVPCGDFAGGGEAAPLWLAGAGLSDGDICGADAVSGED